MSQTTFEAESVTKLPVKKNGLCVICKGAHRLCGKERCPLMIKFYSRSKTMPLVDMKDLAGSSPPAVFVGRYGYPKIDIGPLVPGEFGDTSIMDQPERWIGKSIDDIVDMRYRLVRGKYAIDATDFRKSGKIVTEVQEIALTEKPVDVEANFRERPHGRIVLDDDIQPFGPAARLEGLRKSNGRWEHNLEKNYYDVDLNATKAVLEAYNNGTLISEIQKAFSVGTMAVDKRRRFAPTRRSITAVDDIIGKDYLKRTRFYPTIDEYRVYYWEQLDNRWAIIMMPTTWRFELIEAWYPGTSWNPTQWSPDGNGISIINDCEFFDSRTEYAHIGGCYYASRMAVNELLEREHRTAGAVICREAHEGYVMPVGVWNVRENVRMALTTEPLKFDSMEKVLTFLDSKMDLKRDVWIKNSGVLTDFLTQRRIEDFYGPAASNLHDDPEDVEQTQIRIQGEDE
ncbi:MAG: Nre family DNA repair protein [archaeon]|nr:Nre family DNA repair protein [archaeon]